MVGIPEGAEIYFKERPAKKAIVVGSKNIDFDGKITSLSQSAREILELHYPVQGTIYWMYKDPLFGTETLNERRKRLEQEAS